MDSGIAVSDPVRDGDEDSDGDTIPVARRRKRKRTPSPSMSEDSRDDDFSPADSRTRVTGPTSAEPQQNAIQITIKDMVINVPPGHTGPLLLQLDIPSPTSKQSIPRARMPTVGAEPMSSPRTPGDLPQPVFGQATSLLQSRSRSRSEDYAGFLDLPAELRNEIYRQVFVAEEYINFSSLNFKRSGALLRTCRQVYEEGREILYSENRFLFKRKCRQQGSYWESEWNEEGFKAVRKFLKLIGPTNTGLIRHATLVLGDATPCLNPGLKTADARRFVFDDVLMSILRHLADYTQLRKLELNFGGTLILLSFVVHMLIFSKAADASSAQTGVSLKISRVSRQMKLPSYHTLLAARTIFRQSRSMVLRACA